jgi:hypothetical protein
MSDGQVEDIRRRLEAIGDELADIALGKLREAVEEGGTGGSAVAEERHLVSARRAVLRAAALLAQILEMGALAGTSETSAEQMEAQP